MPKSVFGSPSRVRQSLEHEIAEIHIRRIIRHYKSTSAFCLVVILPEQSIVAAWIDAACLIVKEIWPKDRGSTVAIDHIDKTDDIAKNVTSVRSIVLVEHDAAHRVDDIVRAAATEVFSIGELSAAVVQRAVELYASQKIDAVVAARLASMPPRVRNFVVRKGRDISATVRRLDAGRVPESERVVAKPKPESPRLEDLHGYGEAKVWGLNLAHDLADYKNGVIRWDDVDRGVLLSGAPGCGKTTFAAALAETCGAHFEVASYARWFSKGTGGQGDLIKAMRKSFDSAIANAPAILLIDEIDSFGDRERQPDWHAEWSRQIVNALLECIDGTDAREGVVIVGACNNPSIIDPAILRSGRLDRHLRIALPDAPARSAIIKWHLQADLDVSEAVRRTEGASGADLEKLAREARRAARRDRRTVRTSDLISALPERHRHGDDFIRALAIHEIGHAVVAVSMDCDDLEKVTIDPTYDPVVAMQRAGGCHFHRRQGVRRTREYYSGMVAIMLAGMTAETMFLDSHGDGAIQDLQEATSLARYALGSLAMGDTLLQTDAVPSSRIEDLLRDQRDRSREILELHRDAILLLVERLIAVHELSGEEVRQAVFHAPPSAKLHAI